ncbi:VOC family protein [Saliphagus sp. LR7]|uniref:VOC family protein n=1 Tax=Saliphagus sp. LR7 TaxID=2282654 RepID=UPI000DF7B9D5|nr:VOC family protein [Saliphagus sp. LR7]
MLTDLARLGLEAKSLDPARSFYADALDLPLGEATDRALQFDAGPTEVVVRRPDGVPRGGLHTHFAFSIPPAEYDDWWDRLSTEFDLHEERFGSARSLYCYDPEGNCVELGERDVSGPGIDGIFEVVLEVESLERAETFYTALGFDPVDRGSERRRVRLAGPMALELWEPQLGIADARGGVHVELGFDTTDLAAVERAVSATDGCVRTDRGEDRLVVRDPDGHHLTVRA